LRLIDNLKKIIVFTIDPEEFIIISYQKRKLITRLLSFGDNQ